MLYNSILRNILTTNHLVSRYLPVGNLAYKHIYRTSSKSVFAKPWQAQFRKMLQRQFSNINVTLERKLF